MIVGGLVKPADCGFSIVYGYSWPITKFLCEIGLPVGRVRCVGCWIYGDNKMHVTVSPVPAFYPLWLVLGCWAIFSLFCHEAGFMRTRSPPAAFIDTDSVIVETVV